MMIDVNIWIFPFHWSELIHFMFSKATHRGFSGGTVVKNMPPNAGNTGSSPGLGRSHMPRSN